jgi:hemolysin activation/secretion protein
MVSIVDQHSAPLKHFIVALGLSLIAVPAFGAGTAPSQRSELAPSEINDIESSASSGQSKSKTGLVADQKRSVIENVKVDKSAQPAGDSELDPGAAFLLNGIQVEGNTILAKEDIVSLMTPYLETMVTTADLKNIAAEITKLFVDQGYGTTKCVIPAQQVENGVVVFQVLEDKLGEIRLSGPESYLYDARLFLNQLHDLQGKVIHIPTLNSRLRYLSQLPATRVQPTLVKQSEGITNLVLTLTDLEDSFSLSVNNSGSRFTGANRLSSTAVFNNVTGNSDVFAISATTSLDNMKYLGSMSFDYERPMGSSGGKLGMSYSNLYYRMDPNEVGFDEVRYEGGGDSLGMSYTQPLWFDDDTSNQKGYTWNFGFERKSAQAKTVYNTTFDQPAGFVYVDSEDRLLVGEVGLNTEQYTSLKGLKGRNFASVTLKHAFEGFFGAMTQEDIARKLENNSNNVEPVTGPIGNVTGMDPNFWKLYIDVSRAQALPYSFTGVLSFNGEYTPSKKLPQSYQFAGADGGASGFELNLSLARPVIENVILGVSFKHAQATSWHRDVDPGCSDSTGVNTATSAGRNTCSTNELQLNIDWNAGSLLANVNVRNDVDVNAQNNKKMTFNLGYRW